MMLKHLPAALISPISLFRVPRKTWALVLVYIVCCAVMLGAVGFALVTYDDDLKLLAYDYLLPESWHIAADMLIDHFFMAQQRVVLINAIVNGALIIVTITLFHVKELVSASFERGANLVDEDVSELTLFEEAWQEIKLFALFAAAQGSIFWIGYHPSPLRRDIAFVLSHLFLFFTFAVDFIAPVFQRHEGRYSQILKILAKHPFASLAFGAVFAMPTVIIANLFETHPEWSWESAVGLLFSVNIFCIVFAAIAGTWLGARMFEDFKKTPRSSLFSRIVATLGVFVLLGANAYAFGAVGTAFHHKSQILKCEYELVPGTLDVKAPHLASVVLGHPKVDLGFDIRVKNPTDTDVILETNRIEILHRGEQVGTTKIDPMEIPANSDVRQHVNLSLELDLAVLRRGTELLSTDGWRVTMYIEVAPGFEFPIYLLDERRASP